MANLASSLKRDGLFSWRANNDGEAWIMRMASHIHSHRQSDWVWVHVGLSSPGHTESFCYWFIAGHTSKIILQNDNVSHLLLPSFNIILHFLVPRVDYSLEKQIK